MAATHPFDNVHVGFVGTNKCIVIGRGEQRPNGTYRLTVQSEDRTDEVVRALMRQMKSKMKSRGDPDKPYFGYKSDDMGTLLYIASGYTFSIRPEAEKRKRRK